MFWLTRIWLTLFNYYPSFSVPQIIYRTPAGFETVEISPLLPLLSIYLLILPFLEIAQRCHVTRMSCLIANAHYALMKAIFPHFDICVDSHKDILCLCDIWTCSLYWKMDSDSPDKCFFLGVFQSSALKILTYSVIITCPVFFCISHFEYVNQHSKPSAKVSLVPCTCWENPAILCVSLCVQGGNMAPLFSMWEICMLSCLPESCGSAA